MIQSDDKLAEDKQISEGQILLFLQGRRQGY